jgi:hypothetical protein
MRFINGWIQTPARGEGYGLSKISFSGIPMGYGLFFRCREDLRFQREEDARWAAVVAAKVAGKKQRKFMIDHLAQMASNVLKNYPNKPLEKPRRLDCSPSGGNRVKQRNPLYAR